MSRLTSPETLIELGEVAKALYGAGDFADNAQAQYGVGIRYKFPGQVIYHLLDESGALGETVRTMGFVSYAGEFVKACGGDLNEGNLGDHLIGIRTVARLLDHAVSVPFGQGTETIDDWANIWADNVVKSQRGQA